MQTKETWRVVPHWNSYEVSDAGRVRRRDQLLRGFITKSGYPAVNLCEPGRRHRTFVHRLVALAFIGPQPVGHQVNHKNGIRDDNRALNLEYLTPSQNQTHAYAVLHRRQVIVRGESVGIAKMTDDAVRKMRHEYAAGATQLQLANAFGLARSTVSFIVNRRTWTHVD
jgi:hypothetical protein